MLEIIGTVPKIKFSINNSVYLFFTGTSYRPNVAHRYGNSSTK